MKFAVIVGFTLLTAAGSARAEDLPRLDIKAYCVANAADRGGPASCQRKEESTRGAILARWDAFPKQRKHFCVQSVTFQRKEKRSYVGLAECLDEAKTS